MTWRERLLDLARRYERDLGALALACRDARVPWPTRVLVLLVVAYILSPIDFIPESTHVLGALDDLIVLSLGFVLAVRWVPPDVMADCRARVAGHPLRDLRWWVVILMVLAWQGASVLFTSWWTGEALFGGKPLVG